MATILLAWELGGGMGHCVKLGPLATGLANRGHSIVFAARNVPTAREVLGSLPISFVNAPLLATDGIRPLRPTRTFAYVLHNAGFGDGHVLQSLVTAWRRLIRRVRPSAVVCEHAPTALLACHLEQVRRFVIGTGFSLPPDRAPMPSLLPKGEVSERDLAVEQRLLGHANLLLTREGARRLDRLSDLYAEVEGRYLMTFPELDHHPQRQGDAYRGLWSLRMGAVPQWPEGDGPRVFAYLKQGAPPWRVEEVVAALSGLPVRTIIHIASPSPSVLDLQTPSLRVAPHPVDITVAVAECDAAVLHGTAGASTQFLLGGVPQVLIPLYQEQAMLARRIAQLGAGVILHPRAASACGRALLELIHNGRFAGCAQKFARRYSTYDPRTEQDAIIQEIDALA